jgi:hypothetical protein
VLSIYNIQQCNNFYTPDSTNRETQRRVQFITSCSRHYIRRNLKYVLVARSYRASLRRSLSVAVGLVLLQRRCNIDRQLMTRFDGSYYRKLE